MKSKWTDQLATELQLVYRKLLQMGATKEDAEDIVQETAIQFLHYLSAIEPSKARAWLYQTAIHRFFDHLRKQKRWYTYIESGSWLDFSEERTPEQALLTAEQSHEVQQALTRLSGKDQELLTLKYRSELSLEEMALLYGTTDKTIKTQLARARKRLAQLIEKKEGQVDAE